MVFAACLQTAYCSWMRPLFTVQLCAAETIVTSEALPFANRSAPAFEAGGMPLAEGLGLGAHQAPDQAAQ